MNLISSLPYLNPVYSHQPVAFIVSRFLKKHAIKVNANTLHQKLSEHPYFPSLLSISDTLNAMGLDHVAFKTDFATLQESFSSPLVHLKIQGGVYAIVEQIKDGQVKLLTEKGETRQFRAEDFSKAWDGVVVGLDSNAPSVQLTDKRSYPAFIRYVIAIVSALGTYFLLQRALEGSTWYLAIQLFLNSTGLIISWLLVLEHFNKNNILVQQLCDSKTNEGCGSVLGSKSAQITPWLSMAEAGFMYFGGITLLNLFFPGSVLFKWIALVTPVFSLYAIYLQAFVIKQWCRLCMGVHAVVLISAFLVYIFEPSAANSSMNVSGELLVVLLPGLSWLLINPYIKDIRESAQYRYELNRLKFNPEIFRSQVTAQPKVYIPDELKVFSLGNQEAKHELAFVSNPFCGPCANAHFVIEELLQHDLDFKITIIFSHTSDEGDERRAFAQRLASAEGPAELQDALHRWYDGTVKGNTQKWADELHLQAAQLPYDEQVLQEWLDMADISGTPTFFINGYKLPKAYRIADVRFLITEIQ